MVCNFARVLLLCSFVFFFCPDLPGQDATKPAGPAPSQPASLFNTSENRFSPVEVRVEVRAEAQELGSSAPEPFQVGGQEIITAAGSYGDILRYLQVLPGVVPASDTSNEVLVRGGHPMENLYLLEGFQIPNLNHIARLGSTGGFAPMVDSALVQSVSLHSGGYGARFPDHLSSVTEVNLLTSKDLPRHIEGDFGIQGIGGLLQTGLRRNDLLVSAHHGLLDAVTQNAGLNGVPSYSNTLLRFGTVFPSGDSVTALNVAGWDSIEITPCHSDPVESSSINSQYAGSRSTTGLRWQHLFSDRSFGVLSVTDSEQIQHIHQQDQYADPLKARVGTIPCPIPKKYIESTPVYMEDSNSAVTSGSFRYEWADSTFAISSGIEGWLQRPHFTVEQPIGIFSPFSKSTVRSDATAFSTNLASGETGTFVEASYRGIRNLSFTLGSRFQTIALGHHADFTIRASARYRVNRLLSANIAFATYAQMPPYIYLLSFEQNRGMKPMRVHHRIFGMDLNVAAASTIHIEAYQKKYSDLPAALEYPSVTLHNLPDQLGDEIVWLPLVSRGLGDSAGVELSNVTHIRSRILIKGSLAYARAKFAGTDRLLRPGDFDLPWILNLLSNAELGKGYSISSRFGYASGRPYTPYDLPSSLAQNRPIYDLTRVNALRAPFYSRLDAQLNKEVHLGGHHLELYAGVDNVTNHENFLTFAWLPIMAVGRPDRYPVGTLHQMPIFPNFGVRFIVR